MADYATKKDVEEIVDRVVSKAVDDLTDVIAQFASRVDERFNHLEARVDKLEEHFERLNNTLDAFLKRLDDIETDNTPATPRLLAWSVGLKKLPSKPAFSLSTECSTSPILCTVPPSITRVVLLLVGKIVRCRSMGSGRPACFATLRKVGKYCAVFCSDLKRSVDTAEAAFGGRFSDHTRRPVTGM
jgi:hypothetical protein